MQVYIVTHNDHYNKFIVDVYHDLESAEDKAAKLVIEIVRLAIQDYPTISNIASWVDSLTKMNQLKSIHNNVGVISEYMQWKDLVAFYSIAKSVTITPYVIGGGTPVTKIKCKMCKETLHSNEEYCWKCGLKLS